MIRIFINDGQVYVDPNKAYLKKSINIDVKDHKNPKNHTEASVPLPVVRDMDIRLTFGIRPQTDLEMREEDSRQELMDKEALVSIERQRLLGDKYMDITDPHHQNHINPSNYSPRVKAAIEQAILEDQAEYEAKLKSTEDDEDKPEEVDLGFTMKDT